jgi:hypothetical protein
MGISDTGSHPLVRITKFRSFQLNMSVLMKKVVLRFPDHLSIADFVLAQKPKNAEVNSLEQTVIASLNDSDIEIAKEVYGAILRAEIPKN